MLLCSETVGLDVRLEIEPVVATVDDQADDTSDDDGQEWKAKFAKIEAVDTDIHERKAFLGEVLVCQG